MGVIGCFLCSQEFGCSLMVLGEFLVVQAGFGCSQMFLNVLYFSVVHAKIFPSLVD